MTQNEFLLQDRIAKIRAIDELYDLCANAYLSFSGGKDSCVLSRIVDAALPNNEIPRVFSNTGIEYADIVRFVKSLAEKDNRIKIISSKKNIRTMLEEKGYPFKSKEHSLYVSVYQHSGFSKPVDKYLNQERGKFSCTEKLRYQFSHDFKIKVSNRCCYELKKKPLQKYAIENGKSITMTGMRKAEGGLRESGSCTVFTGGKLKKFHPLFVVEDDFIDWCVAHFGIEICRLYNAPFNFTRTGCKGCPYSLDLQRQLETMHFLLPNEEKQCEMIWKPIYDEYRRIGYRLKPKQPSLF